MVRLGRGRRHDQDAGRRGAGAHLRRDRRVRRRDPRPRCRARAGALLRDLRHPRRRQLRGLRRGRTPPAGRRAGGAVRRRGGRAGLRRSHGRAGRRCRPSRCWSSTSAAARPSWCWGRGRTGRRSRWTSGRSASTSATSTPTRRPRRRSPPAWPTSTQHLDACGVPLDRARTVIGTSGTIKTLACGVLDLGVLRPRRLRPARSSPTPTPRLRRRPGRDDGRGAPRAALHAPRSRRRDRRGGADLEPDPGAGAGDEHLVSEADILHGIAAAIAR